MKCPSCKETTLTLSERKGIEIDYCPDCRGIWLDRGELDKLLEKSREEEKSAAPGPQGNSRDFEQRYRDEQDRNEYRRGDDKYRYKKRKSFLEELFD